MTSVKLRLGRSMPSLSHWVRNTMATSDEPATEAARAKSDPSSKRIFAPGALARIAASGEDGTHTTSAQQGGHGKPSVKAGPVGFTRAEPPPESTARSA